MVRKIALFGLVLGLASGFCNLCAAQPPAAYEPTLDSLNSHPLP